MDGVQIPSSAHAQTTSKAPNEPLWGDGLAPTAHAVLDGVAIAGCLVPALAPVGMAAKAGDACLYLAQGDTWSAGVAAGEMLPLMKWGRLLGEAGELGLKWLPKAGRWVYPLMAAASRVAKPVGETLNGAGKLAKGLAAGNPGMEVAVSAASHYAGPALKGAVRVTVMKQIKPVLHDYLPPDHHQEWMLETANNPTLRYGLEMEHAALGLPGKPGEPGDGLELTREERNKSTARSLDSIAEMRQGVLGAPAPGSAPPAVNDGVEGVRSMRQSLLKELSVQAAPQPATQATAAARSDSAADASIAAMQRQLQQELAGGTQAPR